MLKLVILALVASLAAAQHQKIWRFAIDEIHGVDTNDHGHVSGFLPDLIHAVCHLQGQNCVSTVQPHQECGKTVRDGWYAHQGYNWRVGRGLENHWFDVCTWRVVTTERTNAVEFTTAFQDAPNLRFAVAKGNPSGFDPADISGKTIGLISGIHGTPWCLEVLYNLHGAHYKIYDNRALASAALRHGDTDAMLTFLDLDKDVDFFESNLKCHKDGLANMARKGSGFKEWWNAGFQELVDLGCFKYLCARYDNEGTIIHCRNIPTSGDCHHSIQQILWPNWPN